MQSKYKNQFFYYFKNKNAIELSAKIIIKQMTFFYKQNSFKQKYY